MSNTLKVTFNYSPETEETKTVKLKKIRQKMKLK